MERGFLDQTGFARIFIKSLHVPGAVHQQAALQRILKKIYVIQFDPVIRVLLRFCPIK
jgi:hypothetical protein